MSIKNIWKTTRRNIGKNRWLSLSTIFVITIVFTISTFFIISAIVARQAVSYYETKAQVMVFFKKETPEEEIFKIRDQIQQLPNIEGIEYISQEKAYEIYKQDFQNDQDLVDTITADVLPPSLGIRAKSIDDLTVVINKINEEKDKNAYIDEVWYFEDVVNSLKSISKVIDYGAIALISILGVIAFTLIVITIGFNIMSHKDEIEIMHLVGSEDSFIKWPFIIEGAIYGIIGALISSALILVPWYVVIMTSRGTDLEILLQQTLRDFNLQIAMTPNPLFILSFISIQILVGIIIGSIGSSIAVIKNLSLKDS